MSNYHNIYVIILLNIPFKSILMMPSTFTYPPVAEVSILAP